MRNLTVGFSRPKHLKFPLFSWLIRLYEGTPYSHVYLKWYSKRYNCYLVYHAASMGLHFLGEEQQEVQLDTVEEYHFDLPDYKFHNLVDYCLQKAGTPYGILGVFGLVISRLLGKSRNIFNQKERAQFCTELTSRLLRNAFDIQLPKAPNKMRLRDVEELVKQI